VTKSVPQPGTDKALCGEDLDGFVVGFGRNLAPVIAPILPMGVIPKLHGPFALEGELEGVQTRTKERMFLEDANARAPENPTVGTVKQATCPLDRFSQELLVTAHEHRSDHGNQHGQEDQTG
jgi:hypothetical protein